MGVDITAELSDLRRQEAERLSYDRSGKGTVHYGECPCCGNTWWASSSREPPDTLKVIVTTADSIERCQACAYAFQRHPELAKWIVNVVGFATRKLREPATP